MSDKQLNQNIDKLLFNFYTEMISVIRDVGNHKKQLYQSIHVQITIPKPSENVDGG